MIINRKIRYGNCIWTLGCLLLSAVFLLLARNTEGFAKWYAVSVFPVFQNTIGRAFSVLPFSGFEFGLYIALGFLVYTLIKMLILIITKSRDSKKYAIGRAKRLLCFAGCLLLLFTLTGSINYSRAGFVEIAGLDVKESSNEELMGLAEMLISDIEKLENQVAFDNSGGFSLSKQILEEETIAAMNNLGRKYPSLSGFYPSPKPIALSEYMSDLGITGIFSPFTMEANYNKDIPGYLIPYTICHEFAHFKGFMKEDEAGFIAYLACKDSASPALQYSGAMNALSYTFAALYQSVNQKEFESLYRTLPDHAVKLLDENRNYWRAHTKPVTTIARTANHRYLTANSQTGGSQSYGGMVDLMLAFYAHILKHDVMM